MFIFFIVPIFILALIKKLVTPRPKKTLDKRHVVITGGSSGIGKCVAIEAAKLGANVTIIARNLQRLQEAEKEIRENFVNSEQSVQFLSLDVSCSTLVNNTLLALDEEAAPIYMLVNCAGMAICGEVEKLTEKQVNTLYEVNYLGTLYPIQTLVPKFKERKEGIIVITGSQAGLMGVYGMSIYSSFKFALRGLAESINMELLPFGVSVTLALPPDTDTPGYEAENKDKPEETKLISASAELVRPEIVARQIIKDALAGNFFSYVGFESGMLTTLCVGMTQYNSLFDLLWQSIVLGPIRMIMAYYINSFSKTINRCYYQKIKNQ